jgi:hypothetical protein
MTLGFPCGTRDWGLLFLIPYVTRDSARNAVVGLDQSISASIPCSSRPFHTCIEILLVCNGFAPLRGANFDSDDERGSTARRRFR